MKPRKKKRYEVGVPVREIWVMEVWAYTKKEAKLKASSGDPDAEQTCSVGGSKGWVRELK